MYLKHQKNPPSTNINFHLLQYFVLQIFRLHDRIKLSVEVDGSILINWIFYTQDLRIDDILPALISLMSRFNNDHQSDNSTHSAYDINIYLLIGWASIQSIAYVHQCYDT